MSTTVPGGIYGSPNGTYHNADGKIIPPDEAAKLLRIQQNIKQPIRLAVIVPTPTPAVPPPLAPEPEPEPAPAPAPAEPEPKPKPVRSSRKKTPDA